MDGRMEDKTRIQNLGTKHHRQSDQRLVIGTPARSAPRLVRLHFHTNLINELGRPIKLTPVQRNRQPPMDLRCPSTPQSFYTSMTMTQVKSSWRGMYITCSARLPYSPRGYRTLKH